MGGNAHQLQSHSVAGKARIRKPFPYSQMLFVLSHNFSCLIMCTASDLLKYPLFNLTFVLLYFITPQILHHLYDQDIIQEEAILDWASEKEGAEESDKVFVKQSEKFIQVCTCSTCDFS